MPFIQKHTIIILLAVFFAAHSMAASKEGLTEQEKPKSPGAVEGQLMLTFGTSDSGLSSPELWIQSTDLKQVGGWKCGGKLEGSCFKVRLTKETKLPAEWGKPGNSNFSIKLKRGDYSVRGRISGMEIHANEIKYLGTVSK